MLFFTIISFGVTGFVGLCRDRCSSKAPACKMGRQKRGSWAEDGSMHRSLDLSVIPQDRPQKLSQFLLV